MYLNSYNILKSCNIFSDLQDNELHSLAALTSITRLKTKEILFYRGEQSHDAYVVISGKLSASTCDQENPGEIIGFIMPGEIVGEMSLLTETLRSLTITATSETLLLKIAHKDFQIYCQNNPKIAFHLLRIIVKRTQGVIKHIDKSKRRQFIGLLSANNSVNLNHLLEKLIHHFHSSSKLLILTDEKIQEWGKNLNEKFLWLKQKYEYIIYPIHLENNSFVIETLNKYAEKILLIANGNQPAYVSHHAKSIIKNYKGHSKTELILQYENKTFNPIHTEKWLEQENFFRHHHICIDNASDIQRLGRFITGSAIGLVLGGGGTKGWAHIGALKALTDSKIPIDAICGTSVGSVAGGCYLTTHNFNELTSKYLKLQDAALKSLSLRELTLPLVSLFSGKSATLATRKSLDFKMENLRIPLLCVSCNISQKKEFIHKKGYLGDAIRASASLPGLVPPFVIDNHLHVDGGVVNNLPVDVMSEYLENSGIIIAVSLTSESEKKSFSFPPVMSPLNSILVKLGFKKNYEMPSLFHTFIDSLLMGSYTKQIDQMKLADILIQPELSDYNMLNKKNKSVELMNIGYKSAKKSIEEKIDIFKKFGVL